MLRSFARGSSHFRRPEFPSTARLRWDGLNRMTAPSDRSARRMLNLHTVVGLLVTAGIIWFGLTRIDLSHTMAAFAAVRIEFVLAGSGLIVAVIAIFAVRWHVLLPTSPSVPMRFV